MKWSEFKKQIDDRVKDKDPEIFYIDTGNYPYYIDVNITEDNEIIINGR